LYINSVIVNSQQCPTEEANHNRNLFAQEN